MSPFISIAVLHAVLRVARGANCPAHAVVNINLESGSANWEDPNSVSTYDDLHVTPCTKLRFSYGSNHDVWLMATKATYDACDFSGATLVGDNSEGGGGGTDDFDKPAFEFEITHAHSSSTLYFACSEANHCEEEQKLTVHVEATLTWSSTFGSEQSTSAALAISIDTSDASLLVAGFTTGDLSLLSVHDSMFPAGHEDGFLRKMRTTDGHAEWAQQVGSSMADRFTNIAVADDDNVYVTGWTAGDLYSGQTADGLGYSAFVAAYSRSGELQAPVWWTTLGATFATGIALAGNSTVVVVGASSESDRRLVDQPSQAGDFIAFAKQLSTVDGSQAWNFTLSTDGAVAGDSWALGRDCYMTAVASDTHGDIIVTGHTRGQLSQLDLTPPAGGDDAFVAKLDGRDGTVRWTRSIASVQDDRINALAVDASDDVYIAGCTDGGRPFEDATAFGLKDMIVAKLDGGDGTIVWSMQIGTGNDDIAWSIATSHGPNGPQVAVAGSTEGARPESCEHASVNFPPLCRR